MNREQNDELVRAAISASKISGKRGIVLRGWAGLSLEMLEPARDADLISYAKENILFVDNLNHLEIFPQCCCLVTHGGAGTSAAMMRSSLEKIERVLIALSRMPYPPPHSVRRRATS